MRGSTATSAAAAAAASGGCTAGSGVRPARAAHTSAPAAAGATSRPIAGGSAGIRRSSGCGAIRPPSSETSGSASASASKRSSSSPRASGSGRIARSSATAQLGGQIAAAASQRRQHRADPPRGRARRPGLDRVDARQRLVQQQPERVEVGALVDRAAGGLLGRHVRERADDVPGQRERLLARQVGDAEVRQLGGAAARARAVGHDHVLRLDVAVDHAALVGVVERVGEREPDPQHVAVRELARRLELRQRAPLDQLGDQVAAAVLLAGVEQRHDRVVVQPGDGARLALGALRRRPVAGDDLDRDGTSQELVVARVDGAEAAGAETRAQAVATHRQPGLCDRRQLLGRVHCQTVLPRARGGTFRGPSKVHARRWRNLPPSSLISFTPGYLAARRSCGP